MKRRKIVLWLIWVFSMNEVILSCFCDFSPVPQSSMDSNMALNKFQIALQQQNTMSILSSIEERLRNLDNIYSMQLSKNLETKLDQYSTRLENLDSKLMRLEAIVMMNLGKISENISTKNFKDDMTKTDTLRKLDSIYEGITHRLNYVERKLESNNAKIEGKLEEAFSHLDQMEKGTAKRESDLETELSAVISAVEDLKKTYKNTEQKVVNITEDSLNVSKHTFNLLTKYNADSRKSMNKLHDNIVANLQYLDNRTTSHMKISDETNIILKQMKIELKEDLNSYANKVADMNSDMWRNTDTTEEDLKDIAAVVNTTKTDLQNGIRSLMIQIGKLSQKENDVKANGDYKELQQSISANFDKVLTNQDVFLESCHRLQMDESQIETEISDLLNKLLSMMDKKFSSVAKDIKNIEKNLKNQDNRTNRNLILVNQNILSLSERLNNQQLSNDVRKIDTDLNALFAFVQSTTNEPGMSSNSTAIAKMILNKLNKIEDCIKNIEHIISNEKPQNVSNYQTYKEVQKSSKTLLTAIEKIQNNTSDIRTQQKYLNKEFENFVNYSKTLLTPIRDFDETIKKLGILDEKPKKSDPSTAPTQTTPPERNETITKLVKNVFGESPSTTNQKPKKNCKKGTNIRNLIDIRADANTDCIETPQKQNPTKNPRRRKMKYDDIDIRGDIISRTDNAEDYEYEDTTAVATTTVIATTTTVPKENTTTERGTTLTEDSNSDE